MAKKYDLDDRLSQFAADIATAFNHVPNTMASKYYANQLIRSSGSVALNFSEFGGAGTLPDQKNKLSIAIKECRECATNLKIQQLAKLHDKDTLERLGEECDQITRILVSILKSKN